MTESIENNIKKWHSEWDYEKNNLLPLNIAPYCNEKFWWKCVKGHSWLAQVYVRTKGHGCPYCSGIKAIPGENDLKTLYPEIASEWDYEKNGDLRPENVKKNSNLKVWWICSKEHSWQTAVSHRTQGSNCPVCAEKKVWEGFNDLETKFPDVALQWDYEKNKDLTPKNVSAFSKKKVWWICERGHSCYEAIYSRIRRKKCPVCVGKTVLAGYNDLATICPEIAEEWNYSKNKGILPEHMTVNANQKVWWVCQKGHEYQATVANRNYGKGCPYCVGKKPILGENDLRTLAPHLAKEWDYEKNKTMPEQHTCCSNKKVWWKCKNGHSWESKIQDRYSGNGCPYCVGRIPMRTRFI